MRIDIRSNFVVPGLDGREYAELERSRITLREFLEELGRMSPDPLEYVEPGADRLDPDDWEVDLNGVPYQDYEEGLEKLLKNGDCLTIRILAQGGG